LTDWCSCLCLPQREGDLLFPVASLFHPTTLPSSRPFCRIFSLYVWTSFRGEPQRFAGAVRELPMVHMRFSRGARSGVWEKIFKCLAVDADNEYALIDSTIVRAHQHSAGAQKRSGDNQALGRSRGGTKQQNSRHRGCFGNPTSFALRPGQAHDVEEDDLLLPTIQADAVIADKARRVT
ncbi:MAG: hypothetical protein ACRD4C_00795, partial [Candidatus Acidiferrales bacterium]